MRELSGWSRCVVCGQRVPAADVDPEGKRQVSTGRNVPGTVRRLLVDQNGDTAGCCIDHDEDEALVAIRLARPFLTTLDLEPAR